jgi:putative oxidoreductase
MNLNLTAKTAVVTGACRGIGLATVQTLIDEGVRVVGAASTTVVLEAATREWLLGR